MPDPRDAKSSPTPGSQDLEEEKNRELLRRHARRNCRFSDGWVARNESVTVPERRARTCTDLVLTWTHKNCGYFRDVVDPEANEPCKVWSREMFRRCLDNDVDWFR